MLRNVLVALGATLIVAGLAALFGGKGSVAPALIGIVWGSILVFGIVYERYAYKTVVDTLPQGTGWVRTTERFVDAKSGKLVTVYTKPLTGERAYVAEALETPQNKA
jgi:uncharacterized membrane protein YdjX (TVP38/TMEM64 family)